MFRKKIEYTQDQLLEAVSLGANFAQVLRMLGHKHPGSVEYASLEKSLIQMGIDFSHLNRKRRTEKYDEEMVREHVKCCQNMAQLMRQLGIKSSRYAVLFMDIVRWKIDISHFDGREHVHGRSGLPLWQASLEDIFSGKVKIRAFFLKERLFQEGIKERKCEHCLMVCHMGLPIPLELNHVNGDENDNRLVNLEVVCPNCHSQTWTFAGRNKMLKFSDAEIANAIKNSKTMTAALRALGGNRALSVSYRRRMRDDISRLSLDTRHMVFGKTRVVRKYERSLEDVLRSNSPYKTEALKRRLFLEGIRERRCEQCGVTEWNGKCLAFSLDHMNGVKNDHRLENLRILCFICHARTSNYKGKNIKPENRGKSIAYSTRRKRLMSRKMEGTGVEPVPDSSPGLLLSKQTSYRSSSLP